MPRRVQNRSRSDIISHRIGSDPKDVTKCHTNSISRPTSRPLVNLHQMKFAQRVPKRSPVLKPEPVRSLDSVELNLAPLRITNKSKSSNSVQTTITLPKKERISCDCSKCSERKFEKQRVGLDRAEKNRLTAEQQKYADPLRGAPMNFIERIRELKSYDLDTAKQEQESKKKRKKKKDNS